MLYTKTKAVDKILSLRKRLKVLCEDYLGWYNKGMPNIKYIGSTNKHKLFSTFHQMHGRCANPSLANYKYYGGRGIKVCERWSCPEGFLNFISDMGERPTGYQIDRLDVNGDYEPDNCRWVTKYQQMANTRATKYIAGVNWMPAKNKFRARIKVNRKEIPLGWHSTLAEAVRARKEAEVLYT